MLTTKRKLVLIGAACALFTARPAPSPSQTGPMQPDTAKLPFPGEVARLRDGDYLSPVLALRAMHDAYLASEEWKAVYLDVAATYSSFVGEYAAALALFDEQGGRAAAPDGSLPLPDASRRRDALAAIREAARSHQAVFLNEAHHVPLHRAFAIQLLRELHAEGFRYLAVETLSDADPELAARGYPITARSGLYASEPVFGDLLRTALRLGFQVVPYEDRTRCAPVAGDPLHCANQRDRMQARNLRDRIFARDPGARVLVYAGYGHINEAPRAGWVPMAVHFRELTGIDPFTVDQTVMTERGDPEREAAAYRHAAGMIAAPSVFEDPAVPGRFRVEEYAVDAQVYHPRTVYERGRPSWMTLGGSRELMRFYDAGRATRPPYLLQAFLASEGPGAVPLDQMLVTSERETAALALPRAVLRIRALDASGATAWEERLDLTVASPALPPPRTDTR